MTKTISGIGKRDGVYQFERRIPKAVLDDPKAHHAVFGEKRLYRVPLSTKSDAEVHARAIEAKRTYEGLLDIALNRVPKHEPLAAAVPEPIARRRRPLTQAMLDELRSEYRRLELAPVVDQYVLAQQGGDYRELWDLMVERRYHRSDHIQKYWTGNDDESTQTARHDPEFEVGYIPRLQAKRWVEKHAIDIDTSPLDFGLIVAAIREGAVKGIMEADELIAGRTTLQDLGITLPKPSAAAKSCPTIVAAAKAYCADRGVRKKTADDATTSADIFVEA